MQNWKQKKESLEEHNVAIHGSQMKNGWMNWKILSMRYTPHKKIVRKQINRQKNAKKEAERYEKKLTEIAPMVKDMERFAVKYSYDPEEVLPEAGTLESGKTYREKRQSR